MKLFIQIPCYNEEQTLPLVLASLPKELPDFGQIEIVVIDDGSTDDTAEVARSSGAHHIIRNTKNLGLAQTFRKGLNFCLKQGADIVVNIDGDNQYNAKDLPLLIKPILDGKADITVGDRDTDSIEHFSPLKKILQKLGSLTVRKLSRTQVADVVSGFRAFSREAAIRTTVLSQYTYTLETILQAPQKGFAIESVAIRTNPKLRESRLIKNLPTYLVFSIATIIRVFTMYNPLRVFLRIGVLLVLVGLVICIRYLGFYFIGESQGHVQSLILATICLVLGSLTIMAGLIADLIQFNRRLLEDLLERTKRIEFDG